MYIVFAGFIFVILLYSIRCVEHFIFQVCFNERLGLYYNHIMQNNTYKQMIYVIDVLWFPSIGTSIYTLLCNFTNYEIYVSWHI